MKKLISLCISMAMIIQTIPALANVSTDASDGLEITSVNPVAEFTEVTELFGDSDCEVLSDGEVTDENANISDSEVLSDADIFYSAVGDIATLRQ